MYAYWNIFSSKFWFSYLSIKYIIIKKQLLRYYFLKLRIRLNNLMTILWHYGKDVTRKSLWKLSESCWVQEASWVMATELLRHCAFSKPRRWIEVIPVISIIRHLEGKTKVFSTFSANGLDNLSHTLNVCWLR